MGAKEKTKGEGVGEAEIVVVTNNLSAPQIIDSNTSTVGVLRKRAVADGVTEADIQEADDSDDTKAKLTQLLHNAEAEAAEAGGGKGGKGRFGKILGGSKFTGVALPGMTMPGKSKKFQYTEEELDDDGIQVYMVPQIHDFLEFIIVQYRMQHFELNAKFIDDRYLR